MQSQLGALRRALNPDVALGVVVACVVAMMVVPLPTALLDVLIASNFALSVLLLLVGLSVRDGLAFTSMPTLLLMTTLYRLALNVSSTRLILLQADAGRIIAAFGDFVVRGDYAVGAAVFLVLTIVQYVVVARGAERVAEVGARFSLDALPGKQMAIDADVRSGALSLARARERRQALEQESRFYGAMDGAMKFVKGDAIAGIAIALVSFVAGGTIGAFRDGLPLGQSLRLYGLLTIGDALVSQIPSLLVATSAGLVVTRVASGEDDSSLGHDLVRQLLGNARVLWTGAALFAALMLVPGLPAAPFATLAGALVLLGLRARALAQRTASLAEPAAVTRATELGLDDVQALLDREAKHAPVLVQHVVPQALTLRALTAVLQRLLMEGVHIEPLRPLLEAIVAEGDGLGSAEPGASRALVERVRRRLARRITEAHAPDGRLAAHAIDPMIEQALRDAVQGSGDAAYLALAPDLAADIVAAVASAIDRGDPRKPVLLTQPDVRPWLRTLIEHELPELAVLSYAELSPDVVVERRATVRVTAASAR